MAAVEANIVHRAPGRLRLRLMGHQGDRTFFETLASRLGACSGIRDVEVNPVTRSVLVQHETDEAAILAFGREHDLFVPARPAPWRSALPSDAARHAFETVDRQIQQRTAGTWNLREIAFLMLSVGGIVQMARQNFLPAGLALFWYATTLLESNERERGSHL
jgi:hypothetical protein